MEDDRVMFTDKGEFDGRRMCPYGPEQSGVSLVNSQGKYLIQMLKFQVMYIKPVISQCH